MSSAMPDRPAAPAPWLEDPDVRLYHGDCLEVLRELPSGSVHMCATSPPFFGLRDYQTGTWEGGDPDCEHRGVGGAQGRSDASLRSDRTFTGTPPQRSECSRCGAHRVDRQIGLEETPDQWVQRLVAVFREVRRVLRDDGTLWVEIGDSYAQSSMRHRRNGDDTDWGQGFGHIDNARSTVGNGTKPKDLLGQPWLLAFALRADGWYLRSEIIWARPNPMPESVTDRPTKAHSTVFLLSKQPRYFYDADAIREKLATPLHAPGNKASADAGHLRNDIGNAESMGRVWGNEAGANARSVWTIPTEPTPFAHFATWPQALVRRMILAGTSERGCCPECGAPWVRETEDLTPRTWRDDREGHVNNPNSPERKAQGQSAFTYGSTTVKRTLGWSPSCRCCVLGEWGEGSSAADVDGAEHVLGHHESVGERQGRQPQPHSPSTFGHRRVFVRDPVPCTVLDPFAGSGTTCLVARNHGRHSIGIELNASYLEIAARRLQQLSLLADA